MAAAELQEQFGQGTKPLEPDVLAELQSIIRIHELSAEDLFYKWESLCIKRDTDSSNVTLAAVRDLKQDIQDALEKSARQQPHIKTERRVGATPRAAARAGGADVFSMIDGIVPNTPGTGKLSKAASARKRALETPSMSRVRAEVASSSPDYKSPLRLEDQLNAMAPPSSFSDRTNPGDILEILNEHLPAAEAPICPWPESRIKLTAASDQKKLAYKPLAMKLSEASEILDDRIDDVAGWVQDYHGLDAAEFGSAARQSTTPVVAVGRIASDSPEGRLNAPSLVLETSRRAGGGNRVALDVSRVGASLFPGQVVALRGINTSGDSFAVDHVYEIPLLPNAASAPSAIAAHRQRMRGDPDAMDSDADPAPLDVLFAAGPYTADDNLEFEPLHALCARAAEVHADALVLAGPFIDAEHPLIASGDFDLPDDLPIDPDTATMTTVFKYLVSDPLNRLAAANPSMTILLVPSVRDVVDKHVAWPQDALSRKDLGLPRCARLLSNPMTLSLNDAVLGISSQDVLGELRGEELVVGRPSDTVLLSRLCRHVLEQRHYFPLFPPTDRARLPRTGTEDGVPPGAMLDVSYLKLGEIVNLRPDIVIVPSFLPPFAKVIESVLFINPGFLSKRKAAGTYARMTLHAPPAQAGSDDDGLVANRIFDRARVEITKI
ncbi:DNA polymerase subunit alpha B [Plectosphaerella cucumerina]|uniref:DNA polymerase alpha subunit B n=1 Tax=Plectosphaerella cucumerina TaxID=40658 RepID=A0A8K0TKR8_9PEZI|nr:DNA polymerase subunit alpha B [Plectosphaerella cucumerina]